MLNALAPVPNYSSDATNYINTKPNIVNQLDEEAKIDHYITPKYRLTGELFWESQNAYNAAASRMGSPYTTNYDVFLSDNKVAQIQLTQTVYAVDDEPDQHRDEQLQHHPRFGGIVSNVADSGLYSESASHTPADICKILCPTSLSPPVGRNSDPARTISFLRRPTWKTRSPTIGPG